MCRYTMGLDAGGTFACRYVEVKGKPRHAITTHLPRGVVW
jgi:hypothetical protein